MSEPSKPTSEESPLAEIITRLRHPHIRERRAGIKQAEELIGNPEYRLEIFALIEELAANDPIGNVRQEARTVLDRQRRAHQPRITTGNPEDFFGARCPNGHVSYYDKREVCPHSGTGYRLVESGGRELDKIFVRCKTCRERFEVQVDCEGYK